MSRNATFRVWRGDAGGGALQEYTVEVNEGEVVLDIIHRLQATQAGEHVVRWNCKAGKCGSCSAEINGRPRLLCMTRMSTFTDDEVITVTPLRAFPVIRDLVTDVSFNYEKARQLPSFAPPPGLAPGEYRMAQVDVQRSQEFRKCIECFLCQDVCHVVRDHEENKKAFSGPRFFIRAAELDMHPLDARTDRREFAQAEQGIGMCNITKCCSEVCPGAHQDHRQRDHPDEGTGRRPSLRPAGLAGRQVVPPAARLSPLVLSPAQPEPVSRFHSPFLGGAESAGPRSRSASVGSDRSGGSGAMTPTNRPLSSTGVPGAAVAAALFGTACRGCLADRSSTSATAVPERAPTNAACSEATSKTW